MASIIRQIKRRIFLSVCILYTSMISSHIMGDLRLGLDEIISPQIKDDLFAYIIEEIAEMQDVKTILEIGSSAGDGSTVALFKGMMKNPSHPHLFCIEVSRGRFNLLKERYNPFPEVHCYNVSSIPTIEFPSFKEVEFFWIEKDSLLKQFPLETIFSWLQKDIDYVNGSGIPQNGIEMIKKENQITTFDMVLIDGSEFTGFKELEALYGAKYILLDDTHTFKNWKSFEKLRADPAYRLIVNKPNYRNGCAVFQRVNN